MSTSNGTEIEAIEGYIALIGTSVSQSLVPVVTESIAFASTVFVIIRSRSRVRMKRLVLLAVCVAMYAFAAAHLGLSLAGLFADDRKSSNIQKMVLGCLADMASAADANQCPTMPASVAASENPLTWASVTLLTLTVTLNDTVVLWRAWVLWPRARVVQGISALLILAYIACSLWNIAVDYRHRGISDSSFATMISWLIQAWSTGLIAYRAWQQRQHVRLELLTSFRTSAERVLLLFMECGLVYCLFLTLLAASNIADFIATSNPRFGSAAQRTLSSGIKALEAGALIDIVGSYPTALILLVELSNSYAQRTLSVGDIPTLPPRLPVRAVELRVVGRTRDGGAASADAAAAETVRLCLHAAAGSDASVGEAVKDGEEGEEKGAVQSSQDFLTS